MICIKSITINYRVISMSLVRNGDNPSHRAWVLMIKSVGVRLKTVSYTPYSLCLFPSSHLSVYLHIYIRHYSVWNYSSFINKSLRSAFVWLVELAVLHCIFYLHLSFTATKQISMNQNISICGTQGGKSRAMRPFSFKWR